MIPLISITRNFFLGPEPTKGVGPFRRFDIAAADEIRASELEKMGIHVRDPASPWARSPAASASASRSRARCTSAPRC